MRDLTVPRITDDDARDVLGFLTDYELDSIHVLYDDYLSDYRNSITEPLDDTTYDTMTDVEALHHAGFDVPLFFYEVADLYRIATLECPSKGGGFTCIKSP